MGKVLIVDDDREIVDFLVTLLSVEGIEAVVESEPTRARAALGAHDVGLVLLDVAMPGLDGIELCRQLKADPATREVPIIVLSARPGREVVERSLAAGATEFVRKPFENQELVRRVRERMRA